MVENTRYVSPLTYTGRQSVGWVIFPVHSLVSPPPEVAGVGGGAGPGWGVEHPARPTVQTEGGEVEGAGGPPVVLVVRHPEVGAQVRSLSTGEAAWGTNRLECNDLKYSFCQKMFIRKFRFLFVSIKSQSEYSDDGMVPCRNLTSLIERDLPMLVNSDWNETNFAAKGRLRETNIVSPVLTWGPRYLAKNVWLVSTDIFLSSCWAERELAPPRIWTLRKYRWLVLTGVTSTPDIVTISDSSISIQGAFIFLVDMKVLASLYFGPIMLSIANSGPLSFRSPP